MKVLKAIEMNINNYLMIFKRPKLKGNGVFFALAALTGTSLALHAIWGAFFLLCLLLLLYNKRFNSVLLLLLILTTLLFYTNTYLQINAAKTQLMPTKEPFHILFKESPKFDGEQVKGFAVIQKEKIYFRYRLKSEKEKEILVSLLQPGAKCRVQGEFTTPSSKRNPNQFNFRTYLENAEVYWNVTINTFIEDCQQITTAGNVISLIRHKGLQKVEKYFPEEIVGVSQALLFGERNNIPEEQMELYQNLGVIHLLAISGLHVGLFITFIYFFFLRIGVTKEGTIVIILCFLPLYIFVTGGSAPVIRASLVAFCVLFFTLRKQKIYTIDALSIVFIVLVIINPQSILQVGFQLSFAVSFALLLSRKIVESKQHEHYVISIGKVTMISQLASFPMMTYHFFEVSLIGFITNLLYVPLFSLIILPLVLVCYGLLFVYEPLASLFLFLLKTIIHYTDYLSVTLNRIPFAELIFGRPSIPLLFLYIIVLVSLFLLWERGLLMKGMLLFLFLCSVNLSWNQFSPIGEIVFLDVGQGDAILIKLPFRNGVYLIDTGGNIQFPKEKWQRKKNEFSVGKDIVVPVLKSKGITSLDKLILTHADLDHVGGTKDVLKYLNVKEIIVPPNSQEKQEMDTILAEAFERQIPFREAVRGAQWRAGSSSFLVLAPIEDGLYEGNDDSIVILAKISGKKWLFTGDIEEKGETRLLRTTKLDVDILKVAHHGSNTSTSDEWLEATTPELAIISAGVNNRFGHPHPDVLQRLSKSDIKVVSTQDFGAITYKFWFKTGTFFTEIP